MADKRAYFKVDVGYFTNPKVAAVLADSPTAIILHLESVAYSAQHLTDGIVPAALVQRLVGATADDAALLIETGMWLDRGKGKIEVHDYLEHQRSAAEAKKLSDAGRKAAASRWDSESQADRIADGTADAVQNPMPREKERERDTTTAPRKRGTRIPDDFSVTVELRQWATDNGLGHLDLEAITAEFVDYWVGVAGAKGVKLDWPATWRNWIRRKSEDAPRRLASTSGDQWARAIRVGGGA